MTEQVHKLGEVLRAAREAKGLDLVRVERDTKIRERYLTALERGDYRELPGSVYTKGFLRNYGAYLGLDPEDLIDLYRIETSAAVERQAAPVPPRPMARRTSRAFVVTPGAVVAAILTILVGGFIAYLGYELITFARTPELRIIDPPGNVADHRELSITLRGVTEPNARVTAAGLRENPTVEADADGSFEMTVELLPGSNVVRLVANDPATGRDSEEESRTIIVATDAEASPTTGVATLALDEPSADATLAGEVAVRGSAAPNAVVTVSAAPTGAPGLNVAITDPGGSAVPVEPALPAAPDPTALTADGTGAFSGTLSLAPGRWDLTVVADGVAPIIRSITVAPSEGLRATLAIVDGESYVEAEADGVAVDGSGGIASDGDRIELEGEDELRIRVGNAGAARVRVNGVNLGTMGADGAVVEWRIRPAGG